MNGLNRSGASRSLMHWAVYLAAGASVLGAIGCQAEYNGQMLPSPYYQSDDIQYFPPGTEFKLSREAAALKAARTEEQIRAAAEGEAPLGP